MSRRKISFESYRRRKQERTHSADDIVQGFDDESMQSPEVPAATQPQGTSFLPPGSKKPKLPDIDLTTEPDTAVEQPLPMVPPSLIPLTPPTTSASNALRQMSNTSYVVNFLQCARNTLQSPISSPSITIQEYPRSVANDNLVRAPIKSQRQQQQSSNRYHVAGAPLKSNPHQLSSLTSRTGMSSIPRPSIPRPSMASSPLSLPSKAPSVRTSPPNKRNSVGTHHNDIKRPPHASIPPGSLLADAYSPSGFYSSSPTKSKTSPSQQSYCDVAGGMRGKEKDDTRTMSTSAAAPVYISAGESTDNTGNQARHTVASSSVESDSDVFVMETTSRYFEPKEMNKRRSEMPPVTKEVWPSITDTPPDDILMKIEPTQQRVINVKPRDKNSSQTNFVPQCKDRSPENNHSNLNNDLIASKQHHNCFAKNQSSSGAASIQVESKFSTSTGRAKPRLSQEALNTTPMLSKNELSFIAGGSNKRQRSASPHEESAKEKKRIKLRSSEIRQMDRDELVAKWKEQESYIDSLLSKLKSSSASEVAKLKDSESKLHLQVEELKRRENALNTQLATKQQEMEHLMSQLHDLKQAQKSENAQPHQTLIDPAVNLVFERMKSQLTNYKDKLLDQAQNDLRALIVTPKSSEEATDFRKSAKPSEPARVKLPLTNKVWLSSATPPNDSLTSIVPTQQRVINVKPQDKNSSQINFVPPCKDHSPENNHSNLNNDLITSKQHHNCFAKNQSSSGAASIQVESKSSKSTGRAKPRLSQEVLNTSPTLSKNEFFFIAGEKPAAGREAKPAKKTSQAKKNDEVIFQAEEAPAGRKQYRMRNGDRHIRVSDHSDMCSSEEEDDPVPSPSDYGRSFYRNTFSVYDVLFGVASDKCKKAMSKFNKRKASLKRGGSILTVKGATSTSRGNVKEVLKEFNVQPKVGRIPRSRNSLLSTDEDETTLDLNMVQIGRFISDGAFNLEVKSRELLFPFQCGKIIHRTIIELKHLTSWKMNLGEGPQFIAVEVDMAMTNKLRNGLVTKFHLNDDFFKQGSQDPSQRCIIFHLAGPIYPRDVANINEILSALNGETPYCEVVKEMSSEEATEFLESVKPSEPARRDIRLITNTEMNELSLADRDTSDDATTSTGQSGRALRKEQLGWVRRSTRQKRPPKPVYGTSLMAIEDSDSQEEEPCVQRRPKTPNVKLLTYKPQGSKVTLDIMSADVECLDPGEYLNDKIIDFYLNYLLYEKLSEEFRSRVHIFSTFFYTRLSNAAMDDEASSCSTLEKIHSRVKTWTKRVDLFLKDYIIIPICDRAQWYVVIICHPGRFDPSKVKPPQSRKTKPRARARESKGSTGDSEGEPMELEEEQGESPFLQLALAGEAGESGGEEEGDVEEEGTAAGVESIKVKQEALEEEETEPQKWPCMQILDCLGIKRPSTAKKIRNYLTMEWKSKKCAKEDEMSFEHLPLQYPAIPLLDNSSDCGIFVLQFIESLLGRIQEGLPPPSVAEEWASYEKIRSKRKELKQLVIELQNRDH